jgi:hypothetical protein
MVLSDRPLLSGSTTLARSWGLPGPSAFSKTTRASPRLMSPALYSHSPPGSMTRARSSGSSVMPRPGTTAFSKTVRSSPHSMSPARLSAHLPLGSTTLARSWGLSWMPWGTPTAFSKTARLLTTIDVPGATSTAAFGINDAGQIVGEFFLPDPLHPHGFVATPVPEPATWILFGSAVGLMWWRYRGPWFSGKEVSK